MENLYYSKSEGIAFFISGYDTSTHNVQCIIKYLIENTLKVSEIFNCEKEKIETFVINESRRYKNKRVFYAKIDKPNNSWELPENWTMYNWIIA